MTLNDVIGNYFLNGSIFSKMSRDFILPFQDDVDFSLLDVDFMSLYGNREVSPLVKSFINLNFTYVVDNDGYYVFTPRYEQVMVLDNSFDSVLGGLATIVYQRYNKQWKKLYDTLKVDYNPIHNYDMTEQENTGVNIEQGSDRENDVFGFNSSEAVGDNKSQITNTTKADLEANVRKLQRKGNIGVTTSQKMLTDEREVWKYDFFKEIFRQTSLLLTSPIYK